MSIQNLVQVKAIDKDTIKIFVKKDFYLVSKTDFRLYVDRKFVKNLTPTSVNEISSSCVITFEDLNIDYKPGISFEIATKDNYFFSIDFSYMAQSDEFENKYKYDGQLGSIYSKSHTTFRVYAPFATRLLLNIQKENSKLEVYMMEQNLDNGVFSLTLNGDYEKAKYTYIVTNFGVTSETCDPYSFSLSSNGRESFVIDPKKVLEIPTNDEFLSEFIEPTKAIIYECSVRDMTSLTKLENKGTYKCLSDTASLTKEMIGINYIASLGVSHVQLLPTMDFSSVDEDNPKDSYNWGYDPNSYFAPEGSYALNPNDPYSRIFELRNLIASFHKRGLRVIQDVVYNHVYSTMNNMLNVLVPGYYLRRTLDGNLSNGSGCGNDIESRIYMARKLIIDSLVHYIKFYDVDGFRFDLMGILDIDTINKAKSICNKKKKNLLFYGEGWDLWTALDSSEKASMNNSSKLLGIGFFNDRFRDIVKGKTGENDLGVCGYLSGDTNYIDGFKHVMLGSCKPLAFAPLFLVPDQSINFVECHDNHTLFDKLSKACIDDSEDEILRRVKMIEMSILLACGVPFIHAGQEIGMSKKGYGNTYNMGDEYNGFNYNLLKERKSMVEFFKDGIKLRRFIEECSNTSFENLASKISFENLDFNALLMTFDLNKVKIHVIFNPTKNSFMYTFPDYVKLIFNENGDVSNQDCYVEMAIINALGCFAFLENKEEKK